MNNQTIQALEAAFAAIGELTDEQKALGIQKFEDSVSSGLSVEEALWATLDAVAEDSDAWKAGNRAFNECLASQDQIEETAESESFDPVIISGIEKAVAAATDDEGLQALGIKTYVEAIRQGQDTNEALSTALDATAQGNEEVWLKGQAAYYENISDNSDSEPFNQLYVEENAQSEENVNQKPQGKWLAYAILAALVIVVVAVIEFSLYHPTPKEVTVEQAIVDHNLVVQQAEKALFDAGWKPGEFSLDTVDASKDMSTAGNGSFDKKGIKDVASMMNFLKSETTASKAVVESFMKDAGATKDDVLNPLNWVVVQSNKAFGYPANTLLKNGEVVAAGARKGGVGDIFLMFVAPAHPATATTPATPVRVKVARGACVNPQNAMPTPVQPIIPPEVIVPEEPVIVIPPTEVYLQPKSDDPDDYKYPAKKPEVTAEKKAEKKAPEVDSRVEGVSGVVDKPTNEPGSESGVVAPDAQVVDEDVREKAPEPEKNVNPVKNDETNVADPGLPQGF